MRVKISTKDKIVIRENDVITLTKAIPLLALNAPLYSYHVDEQVYFQ
jgi:hypothetical protein